MSVDIKQKASPVALGADTGIAARRDDRHCFCCICYLKRLFSMALEGALQN